MIKSRYNCGEDMSTENIIASFAALMALDYSRGEGKKWKGLETTPEKTLNASEVELISMLMKPPEEVLKDRPIVCLKCTLEQIDYEQGSIFTDSEDLNF